MRCALWTLERRQSPFFAFFCKTSCTRTQLPKTKSSKPSLSNIRYHAICKSSLSDRSQKSILGISHLLLDWLCHSTSTLPLSSLIWQAPWCVTLQAQSLFSTQSSSEQIKMESWVTSSGPGFGDITFFYNAERQNVCWREKESHNDNELWITNIDTERELASHRSAHLSIHPSQPLVLTKLPLFPTSVFSCQSIKPPILNI